MCRTNRFVSGKPKHANAKPYVRAKSKREYQEECETSSKQY